MANLHSPSPPPSFSSSEKEEGEESASQSSETSYFIKAHQDLNGTLLPKSTEEDDEEEEEEDPEEDPEEDDLQNQKALVLKAADDPEEESGESGFASGSEAKLAVAVLSHGAPNPNIQPISSIGASRIKNSVSKTLLLESAKRSAQKRTAAAAAPPEQTDMASEKRRQKKRLNADALEHLPTDEEDSKKGGLKNEGDEVKEEAAVDRKLHPFQRIWSPKDEIAVLTAMIKYLRLRDPSGNSSDKATFHAFVRERVRMDVTRSQVGDKVRRFKKKFLKRVNNAVSRGKGPVFSNDHERLVYELSKQIWGDTGLEPENCPEIKDGGGINATKDEVKNTAGALYPYLIESLQSSGVKELGEFDLDRVLKLIDHSQAKEWNERWMDIRSKERNIYMERLTLVHQQVNFFCDLLRPSEET